MATRLLLPFDNVRGDAFEIRILDDNYTGEPVTVRGAASGLALRYEGPDDETHAPTIGSTLTFTLIRAGDEVDAFVADILTTPEGELRAHLYRNGVREWIGVILPDTITVPIDYLNGPVEVTAVDDLGLLASIDYKDDDGTPLNEWDRIPSHVLRILRNLRTVDDWTTGAEFLRVYDHLTGGTADEYQAGTYRTQNISVHGNTFWTVDGNVYTFTNALDALEQLALIMGARIFQAGGVWHFCPPWIADISTALPFYSFTKSGGAFTAAGATLAAVDLDNAPARFEAGFAATYGAPMRSVYRRQKYLGNVYLLDRDLVTNEFGDTITAPNSFDYETGAQFTVAGTLKITQNQIAGLTGPDRLVRYKLIVRLTIPGALIGGTRYYNAPAPDPSSAYAVEGYTLNTGTGTDYVTILAATNAGPGEWITSPSAGWELWTPPLRAGDAIIDADTFALPFTFTTIPTLTDGINLQITVDVVGVTGYPGATGGAGSGINYGLSATYQAAATFEVDALRVIYGDGSDNGNVIRYGATVSSGSPLRETLDIPDALMGDKISDNTRGRLRVYIGGEWKTSTRWKSHIHDDGATINRVLCLDRLALRRDPLTIIQGTVHRSGYITPLAVLVYEGDRYIATAIAHDLHTGAALISAYRIQDNPTGLGPTDDDGTIEPVAGTKGDPAIDIDGVNQGAKSAAAIYNALAAAATLQAMQETDATTVAGLQSAQQALANIGATVATHETKLGYITVSEPVDLDNIEGGDPGPGELFAMFIGKQ